MVCVDRSVAQLRTETRSRIAPSADCMISAAVARRRPGSEHALVDAALMMSLIIVQW